MKYSRWVWLFSVVFFGMIVGFIAVQLNKTTPQTQAQSAAEPVKDDKMTSHTWRPKEFSIQGLDSKFTLNLPDSLKEGNWAIGVKEIDNGQNEMMKVAKISWKKSDNDAFPDTISEVEEIPDAAVNSFAGQMNLNDVFDVGKSLIIWLEVAKGTKVTVNQGGKTFVLDGTNNLFVDNKITSENRLNNIAQLVGMHSRKKAMKDFKDKGFDVKEKGGKKQ